MDRARMAMEMGTETDTTKPQDSSVKPTRRGLTRIRTALTELALFRQAKVTEETLKIYSVRLGKENVDDVLGAISTIQDLPRLEGELSFPEIGVFLAVAGSMAVQRENRASLDAKRTTLAGWKCPDCGTAMSGLIAADDERPRKCVCGALMEQIHREDNFHGGNYARTA